MPTCCHSPRTTSGRPVTTSPARKAGLRRSCAGQRQRADGTHESADADRGVQVADSAVPEVEELDRGNDDEDLNRTEHCRLRGEEADHDPQGRVPGERREPGQPLGRDGRRVELPLRLRRRAPTEMSRRNSADDNDQRRGDREDHARARGGDEDARERGSGEDRDALDPARDGVRRSELLGGAGERRRECGLGRAERRVGDRRGDREAVDDQGSASREDADRRRPPTSAIRVSSSNRRTRSRGYRSPSIPANGATSAAGMRRARKTSPTRLLAADPICVDGDGDEERVVADDRRRPGELEPAQVRVRQDGRKRGDPESRGACDSPRTAGASHSRLAE